MIREFHVGCHKVINLGNYQSVRVEAGLTVVVPDGDDYELVKRQALQDLKVLLEDNYRVQMKSKEDTRE
jgi:hypothetical protein